MLGTIIHRGPDDEGVYIAGCIGLGNRRLSIIDLPGGRQPISNEDGTVWVVYNEKFTIIPNFVRNYWRMGTYSTHALIRR
jgi:hypothetical protein